MEERIKQLEEEVVYLRNLIDSLIKSNNISKQYTDWNIEANVQNINKITPYVSTKQAYFGDNQVTFYDVPEGNVSVFFDSYLGPYSFERVGNMLTVSFDVLTVASTNVTISIQ